jgi:hypothetical protein
MAGDKDLAKLFARVTALEQRDEDEDLAITRIVKRYDLLGITVTMTYRLHQYRLCGDTNPLFGATVSANNYL